MNHSIMALFALSFSSCLAGCFGTSCIKDVTEVKEPEKNQEKENSEKEQQDNTKVLEQINNAKNAAALTEMAIAYIENNSAVCHILNGCNGAFTQDQRQVVEAYTKKQAEFIKEDFKKFYVDRYTKDETFKDLESHEKVAQYIIHLTEGNHENDKIMHNEWLNLIFEGKVWPRGKESVKNKEIKESYKKIVMKLTESKKQKTEPSTAAKSEKKE